MLVARGQKEGEMGNSSGDIVAVIVTRDKSHSRDMLDSILPVVNTGFYT